MDASKTDRAHRMPTWVKVFVIIAVAAVLLLTAVLVFGGDDHGPRRHTPGHADACDAPGCGTDGLAGLDVPCPCRPPDGVP